MSIRILLLFLAISTLSACGTPQKPTVALYEDEVDKLALAYAEGLIGEKELLRRQGEIDLKIEASIKAISLINKRRENQQKLADGLNVDLNQKNSSESWSLLGTPFRFIGKYVFGFDGNSRNRPHVGFKERK